MPLYIYSWNAGSEGAKELAGALGIRRIRHERSTFKGSPRHTVINWGSSQLPPEVLKANVLNPAEAVAATSNKLSFFRKISETQRDILPPWTVSEKEALAWIAEGHVVVARTILNSSGGNGIVIMDRDNPRSFVKAPLYTRYVKKDEEYRVHVFRNEIIGLQRKVIRRERAEQASAGGEPINWKIRNLANGFVYQRENINPSDRVREVAVLAQRASGLDFGGVDVIFNRKHNRAYVLEINSAPGLQGTTVTEYAQAFRQFM
jgi:glutathione synthase/RimK-type ligase-like ATP-grasp enzyme